MAMMCFQEFLIFTLLMLPCAESGGNFLGAKTQISTAGLRAEVTGVIGEVLGDGHGVAQPRLDKIRGILNPLFKALPKNSQGRVSAPIMRYAVRRYFSQGHAWIVKGFEPHADPVNVSNAGENILQSKAPGFIRSLLEEQFSRDGFALNDVVAMVASLERLAFDEVMKGVELAFWLNSVATTTSFSRETMEELLASYLIIEMLEGNENKEQHKQDKAEIKVRYPNWGDAHMFLMDIAGSDDFHRMTTSNPFKMQQDYQFEDIIRMTERVSEEFGPWSSYECHDMKNILSAKDVHGTGRVRLLDFYKASEDGAWQFLEPSQMLRQNGALDESSSYLGPQVMIANYITGMSNCITSAPYYAICCLNECDVIFQHLEGELLRPKATAAEILAVIEAMPQSPEIAESHRSKLETVANHHGGMIPIHGRLLAQWLHFVFPRECPYPHMASTLDPKTQAQWREQVGEDGEAVSEEEVAQHSQAEFSKREASPEAGEEMWTLEEVLMPESTISDHEVSPIAQFFSIAAQVCVVGAFAGVAIKEVVKIMRPSTLTLKASVYDV
jgi:hypothetical protein